MKSACELITVVIPVYNRESIVASTLDSVAIQTPAPRLIVVDNASTDGSLKTVKEWAERHSSTRFPVTVTVETAKGAAAARQKGLQMVDTPFVLFFDSDDIMLPGHIDRLVRAIEHYPGIDIFGWDIHAMELDGRRSTYPFSDRNIAFRHIFNGIFSTQRYAASTELIRSVGGWDPTVLGWDDYELGVRLICSSPQVKYLPGTPTVAMKRLADSITGTDFASGAEKWEYAMDLCRRTLSDHGNGQLVRWLDLKLAVLAGLYRRENAHREASRLLKRIMDRETSAWRRTILAMAFHYTAVGGRGIHHILRPIL